jgi:hypothetical protein
MQRWLVAALGLLLAGCAGRPGEAAPGTARELGVAPPAQPPVRVPARSTAVAAPQPAPGVEEVDHRAKYRVELTAIYATLRRSCGECHGGAREPGPRTRMEFSDSLAWMVERGFVWPLDGAGSPLVVMMADGSMPPAGVEPRPSAEEIQALLVFIDDAGNWSTLAPDPALYGPYGFVLDQPEPEAPREPLDAGADGG